jgi:uncharacterized protein YfkK (UPF0435 family)
VLSRTLPLPLSLRKNIINQYALFKLNRKFMQEVSNYTQEITNRISQIVENLFKSNSFYMVRLKKQERIEHLVNLFSKFSPEEFRAIPDYELTRRIDKLLVLEAVSGTLSDLTPEQIKIFDEAVEGR